MTEQRMPMTDTAGLLSMPPVDCRWPIHRAVDSGTQQSTSLFGDRHPHRWSVVGARWSLVGTGIGGRRSVPAIGLGGSALLVGERYWRSVLARWSASVISVGRRLAGPDIPDPAR
ncbi:MAG TPA: hypothetical protein VF516_00465 [Kofleriaceae bacterium]